jgi:hypothetical protein
LRSHRACATEALDGLRLELQGADQIRNTGITLARTSSDPIGGQTRLIATALLAWSGAYLSVALFLLLFVLIGLVSVYLGPETHDAAFESDPAPVLVEESQR